MTTDPMRQEFEKWFESEIKPNMNGTTTEFVTKEIMFTGYQAALSHRMEVTDEMALRGAWAPRNEFCKQAGLQPFDPRQKPDIKEIEQARLIISAALNGGVAR